MLNSTYPSSTATLKRSISTPGTLFLLKSLNLDGEQDLHMSFNAKNHTCNTFSKLINKTSLEGLAKQLTLIDWSIFLLISRNELKPGQWTSPMKQILSPNVVAFTRRFNNLTFWVIEEILSFKTPKQRVEVISSFIKICNYLIELNNFHSSYAIKSALTSASVHRLEKTWTCLNKKDRQSFEKICDLFNESENNYNLRHSMDMALKSRSQTCIPNLATFLRDIIHIDSAYPQNEEHLSSHRYEKLESIYNIIEKCQQSNYDFIELVEDVYDSLNSFNYIEELQKFREDSYFKLSQKLEPTETQEIKSKNKLSTGKFNSHYDIRALQLTEMSHINRINSSYDLNKSDLLNKSLNEVILKSKVSSNSEFKPGHRKTNSLETDNYFSQINHLNNNHQCKQLRNMKINLIDDTVMFDNNCCINGGKIDKKPTLEMNKKALNDSFNYDDDASSFEETNDFYSTNIVNGTIMQKDLIYTGLISRKTILKDRKKPSLTFWFQYYLALSDESLLFFNTKSYCQTKGFNSKPVKSLSLINWSAYIDDSNMSSKKNTFTLTDHALSVVYRIKTPSDSEAKKWVTLINKAISDLKNVYFI